MIIIIISLITLYIILFLISRKKYSKEFSIYSKKENPLLQFYPLAAYLMDVFKIITGRTHEQVHIARFKKLYPKGNGKEEYRRFMLHRNSIILLLLLFFLMLSAVSEIMSSYKEGILKDNKLARPLTGNSEDVSLLLYTEGLYGKEIDFNIRSRRLRDEELKTYFEQVKTELETALLAENESFDYVYTSLNFIEEIPDSNMHISWRPEDTSLISITGKLYNENISKEGVITYINLILNYYEDESMEYIIPLRMFPPGLTERELIINEIVKAYKNVENNSIYEELVSLPDTILDKKILWEEKKESGAAMFFIYGSLVSVIIYFAMSNGIKKKEKFRERQMMLDYSNIISKFTLFLTAGMTIRGAWECIASDYEKKQKINNNAKPQIHFAYEEMLTSVNELKVGVSESIVYDNYGKRCMLIPYIKFTSIIVQNLKKGTAGILPLLEMEKSQAFSERKEITRRLGEEAGTKLQAPLMIYLVIVLIIVLVPAFLSL